MAPGTLTTGEVVRGLSEQVGAKVLGLGYQLWKAEANFGPGGALAVVGREAFAGGGDVGRAVRL